MSTVKVTTRSIHFTADEKLIKFIEERIEKLSNLSDNIIEAEVYLRLEKDSNTENKMVEIKLAIPGNDLFAKKNAKTFEVAVDGTVEALRRQLKKRKEKVLGY